MIRLIRFFAFFYLLCYAFNALAQIPKQHRLKFKNAKQLHQYFKYQPDKKIISGHRGTVENGFPENSIAALEEVLKHTPAFFEIDPRLTKDSVIVIHHDKILGRTVTGSGKVSDYTWEEIRQLKLKNKDGKVTNYDIPTLEEVMVWAKGKTIINLDKIDVPFEKIVELIKKHRAGGYVMVTVHNAEQAKAYLKLNKDQMFSAWIRTEKALKEYEEAGIPFSQLIAYVGPEINESTKSLINKLNAKGVMCMIGAAPSYDLLKNKEERGKAYRMVMDNGASILETDVPIEALEFIK